MSLERMVSKAETAPLFTSACACLPLRVIRACFCKALPVPGASVVGLVNFSNCSAGEGAHAFPLSSCPSPPLPACTCVLREGKAVTPSGPGTYGPAAASSLRFPSLRGRGGIKLADMPARMDSMPPLPPRNTTSAQCKSLAGRVDPCLEAALSHIGNTTSHGGRCVSVRPTAAQSMSTTSHGVVPLVHGTSAEGTTILDHGVRSS